MPGLDTDITESINNTDPMLLTPQLIEAYDLISQTDPELIYPTTFDIEPEKLDHFKQVHGAMYHEQAQEIVKDLPQIAVIYSGMFGGKTTLAFEIEDALRKSKHLNILNAIAFSMGESYVTARSYTQGATKRDAFRFGGENYEEQIETLMNNPADYIFLDEFSFLIPTNPVVKLIDACKRTGKGLLLTGLNTNFLGDELPMFQENSLIMADPNIKKFQCHSFVSGICDEYPQGTNTIRYANINIGNGKKRWVYDLGLYPLVVSKEYPNAVHYAPAMEEQTARYLLRNNRYLQDAILHPTEYEEISRKILLKQNTFGQDIPNHI